MLMGNWDLGMYSYSKCNTSKDSKYKRSLTFFWVKIGTWFPKCAIYDCLRKARHFCLLAAAAASLWHPSLLLMPFISQDDFACSISQNNLTSFSEMTDISPIENESPFNNFQCVCVNVCLAPHHVMDFFPVFSMTIMRKTKAICFYYFHLKNRQFQTT